MAVPALTVVGDINCSGTVFSGGMVIPAGAILSDAAFLASQNFGAALFQYGMVIPWHYDNGNVTVADTAGEFTFTWAQKAGSVVAAGFAAWTDPTGGSSPVTEIMLHKNKTTDMFGSAVQINSSTGDNTIVAASIIGGNTYVANDSFSIQVVHTGSGTYCLGLRGWVLFYEDAV